MGELMRCDGFDYSFDPKACEACQGNCCVGESGYIWVSPEELEAIAHYLEVDKQTFINEYLLKIRYRFTLKEVAYKDGFTCLFFDTIHKRCSIYPVRPSQCKTFPFWDHFKKNINEVIKECPGITGY